MVRKDVSMNCGKNRRFRILVKGLAPLEVTDTKTILRNVVKDYLKSESLET